MNSRSGPGTTRNQMDVVDLAIRTRLSGLGCEGQNSTEDESFFVADLSQVIRQHRRWRMNLPEVHPYYAVKCNPDPTLLRLLADLETGFDCASIGEMRSVLRLGVDPARIIFANPCKSPSSLVFARKAGITYTTFDNLDELQAIQKFLPNARLALRIFASDKDALVDLSEKFGAPVDDALPLLQRARELGLEVSAVSFHVGTGAQNAAAYVMAIRHSKLVLEQGRRLGHHINVVDIGGGFQDKNFDSIALPVRQALITQFPTGVRFIAEPGRYYARSAYTLACKVISRRQQMRNTQPDMLYQNDGVYGNFMNVLIEKEAMRPSLVFLWPGEEAKRPRGMYHYSIWGPTCDSVDCIVRETTFNSEVRVGDWLRYNNMGAYTTATATQFNGFPNRHDVIYINSGSSDYEKYTLLS